MTRRGCSRGLGVLNEDPPLGGVGSLESVAYEKLFLGMKSKSVSLGRIQLTHSIRIIIK